MTNLPEEIRFNPTGVRTRTRVHAVRPSIFQADDRQADELEQKQKQRVRGER